MDSFQLASTCVFPPSRDGFVDNPPPLHYNKTELKQG